MLTSILEVCQEWWVKKKGTWRTMRVPLTGDLEDMVIFDVMNDLILPQEKYPESFVLTSLLEVCL